MLTALVIFIITYIFIGLRQIPRVHIDRPAGALVGAVLMVVFGVLTLDQAFSAVDLHTLLLLLGMMIITVYLRAAGFFELMADKILSRSRTPLQLLVFIALSAGLLSALFVNDTICLLYTPIVLAITIQLGVNPMPYLLALATASNIGSVMTVTGNPQNMLIGIYSQIPYLTFLAALFPVAIAGLAISVAVIWFLYRKEMRPDAFSTRPAMPVYEVNKPLLVRALLVCAAILVGVLAGLSLFAYRHSRGGRAAADRRDPHGADPGRGGLDAPALFRRPVHRDARCGGVGACRCCSSGRPATSRRFRLSAGSQDCRRYPWSCRTS